MQPEEPVYEIMQRTMYNLEFVEKNKSIEGPYETTQLLNSFLGALAHHWEQYRKELNKITIEKAHSMGWPKVEKELDSDINPKHLGDLIRLIRNGLAHGNFILYPDSKKEIKSVLVWNINIRSGVRDWGAILTIVVLRQFLLKFVELAEKIHKMSPSRKGDAV